MEPVRPGLRNGPRSPSRAQSAGLYAGVLLGFGLLYALTAQRGAAWQDSGEFQWRIAQGDVKGELGLALSHPLLIVLGRAFAALPFGEEAWRTNLLSAVCGAVAAANIALLVLRLAPGRPLAAWLAAGFWGLAHTPWWLATICESQALLAAIFTLELNLLLSLVRRPGLMPAAALGLASGLGWTAHNLALLALPAYGVTVLWLCARGRLRWWAVPLMIGFWCAGGSMMLALIATEAARTGLGAAIQSALFGQSWRGNVLGGSARAVVMGGGYILLNFPNLALPLAALGLWTMHKSQTPILRRAFYYLMAAYLLFAIRYTVADQFMFFLPFYALVAVAAGIGFARFVYPLRGAPESSFDGGSWEGWLWRTAGRHLPPPVLRLLVVLAMLALGPVLYAVGPGVWRGLGLPKPGRTDLPFRDPVRYWLTPWKHNEDSARRFVRAAEAQLRDLPPLPESWRGPRTPLVIADPTSYYPLVWSWNREVRDSESSEGFDVILDSQATPQNVPVGSVRVFVVSKSPGYCPEWLTRLADLHKGPHDVLYHVVWFQGTSVPASRP